MGTGHQVGEPLPLRTTLGRGTDGSRSANDSGQAAYMGVIQWRGFSFLATSAAKLGKTADTRGYRFLNKYFRNSRRRVGEGINDYITRKTETYWRACQALKRVMPRTRPTPTGPASWTETPYGAGSAWNSRRSSWASTTSNPDGEARLRPRTTLTATRPRPHGHGLLPRGQHGTGVIEFLEQLPELLLWELEVGLWKPSCPDGEGGHSTARSTIAGKEQGGHAYLGEELEQKPEDEHEPATVDYDLNDNLNEEGSALWAEGQQEIEEACAVLRDARRTLRAAREKQHQVKMARKYYQPRDKETSGRPRDDSAMTCLKCGRIGHRARNCPTQSNQKPESSASKQMAPFVCYAQSSEAALAAGPTTQEAVAAGCCVVDGGATKTLGSVTALEKIFQRNIEKHGENRVKSVDLSDRPVFGFGNSSEGQCVSTINLGVKANQDGSITVHALDEGEGPVLFSIDALRRLDALIDFRRDLAVFRELDPCKVISLKRSQTGHQLLDLTEDFFANARGTTKPVPPLDEFL
eukprot:s3683_g7.t1